MHTRAGLASVVVVMAIAGCGGGQGESPSAEAKARADYIAAATELCRANRAGFVGELQERLREETAGGAKTAEAAQIDAVRSFLVPRMRRQNEELLELGVPRGDRSQVQAIVDAMGSVLDEAERDPARFLYRQSHFKHPFARAHDLAEAYGIPACARV